MWIRVPVSYYDKIVSETPSGQELTGNDYTGNETDADEGWERAIEVANFYDLDNIVEVKVSIDRDFLDEVINDVSQSSIEKLLNKGNVDEN